MQHREDIGWLDIGVQEDSRPAVLDSGRLKDVIAQLSEPESQYPSLCAFIGGKLKDSVLQKLYPWNNIKRHTSEASIRLRYDVSSLSRRHPVLFADGSILQEERFSSQKRLTAGAGLPISWNCTSALFLLHMLWSRLIFLFTDVICIFVDDCQDTEKVVDFLLNCWRLRSISPVCSKSLPRVILIYGEPKNRSETILDTESVIRKLAELGCNDISESFSDISSINIADNCVSTPARYEPLRALVASQLDATRSVREEQRLQLNGKHLVSLFQSALQHLLVDVDHPFDFVKATREVYTVSPSVKSHIVHYLEISHRADLSAQELAPSIASAILMDNYVPGMLALEPRVVFQTLYRSAILDAYRDCAAYWPYLGPEEQVSLVELQLVSLFDLFSRDGGPSVQFRKSQLASQSGRLCRIRSNRICLYCLFQSAQHILGCGHTLCDRCAQVFGTPSPELEYQFTIRGCAYCLYKRPLIVDVLPSTMGPSILAIDGGGVRGVIPLEFLLLVQEHLRPCLIQDVVDLSIGTSSGGLIALGLFVMSWNVSTCSEIFEDLARRIFRERRHSPFLLLNRVYGKGSILGEIGRWIQWLLHDSCYDARVFDAALRSAFGENRRMFGTSRDDPRGALRSNSKVGVVTTSISRETNAFVIGNFNAAHGWNDEDGKGLFRPIKSILRPLDARHEPTGIGSFQDGGLKHNFAGGVAIQVCRQIWPAAMGATRLVSLGTGIVQAADDQTPHFRHIFRDGFVRRAFDAWMSTMDTEGDWKKMRNQLGPTLSSDCHRLNVKLGDMPNTIDSVENMEQYRNLVILQPGSARIAREAATTLLISRFYFELNGLPENTATPFWCRGVIRCKGSARDLIVALTRLYPDGLSYTSSSGLIDTFTGLDELCASCGSYVHPLSFLTYHIDHKVDVFLQTHPDKRWRISGFPESLATFAAKQGLMSSFGQSNHGHPTRAPCSSCDAISGLSKRRRRSHRSIEFELEPKRVCTSASR
ncbi:hypothetical protein N7467_012040 [Penicillium canescens]|nr:hypothetical protein N7467_012040 [Penicillium canescens]